MTCTWSISRRLTASVAIAATFLVLTTAGLTAWFVQGPIGGELEALVVEELAEFEALLAGAPVTRDRIIEVTQELSAEHPQHGLAWSLSNASTGEPWGRFGAVELFDDVEIDSGPIDFTSVPASGLRWRVARLGALSGKLAESEPLHVGLLVDGRGQLALIRTTGMRALVALILAAVLATIGGALYGRRISNMLREVADNVRSMRSSARAVAVDVERAPEEIRDVAEALSEMLENVRDRSSRAQLMTAGLAHELRSPIQNLLGEAELALMREREAAEYRQVLESQVDELRDLGRVVDNLVTLCAAEESDPNAASERFDLGREAELRLRKERVFAERVGVDLVVHASGDLAVQGDREALLLAVSNLVGNAVHWTPKGGEVRLGLNGDDDNVTITVEDEGPGIDASEREKVFEPFYQGPAKNGRRSGYGLGLALTRTAVRAHEGAIELDRSPLGGARFRVELPRRRAGA
ncbi:MAG: hypothetical protein GY711_26005 [bacterium]|nr:hypothetical protein [bacterium]